jgi:3',5'-cyclic AMP phosphodiesterase CpdA
LRQILHISDIHFGPFHARHVAAGVEALVAERRPDLLVISGDLTQRAKASQFREARAWVDGLGLPTLVVPGNHDVPLYRVWERLFAPYAAYQEHFSKQLEPDFEDDEMLVVGINTAYGWTLKDGRIRRRRLRQVAARLAAAPAQHTRIVVAHHELVPAPRFDHQRVLRNAYEAVETFTQHGVDLVLSGHLHQSYVMPSEAYYPSGRRPFLIVHAGTTTSHRGRGSERRRYTCNWITLDGGEVAVSCLGWDDDEERFTCWSRHHYPLRRNQPYGLELESPSISS